MKDALRAVRKAYATALDNIVVNGAQVPFYDIVPESGVNDYIYIESLRSEETSDKSELGQTVSIGLAVITDYHSSHGRVQDTEDIGEKAMNTIRATVKSTLDLTGDGFYMITSQMTGTSVNIEEHKNKQIIKRSINFRHIVGET